MSMIIAREANKANKARKNIMDNHHNNYGDPMKWGSYAPPISKSQQVGDNHILAMYKRVQKDIKRRQQEANRVETPFDIASRVAKAVDKVAKDKELLKQGLEDNASIPESLVNDTYNAMREKGYSKEELDSIK